ncbi:MAG: hypothetical protein KC503_17495 [Myxococcales bacterium]|nr:hypothetical protein [Myxococcales bacterium]
MAIVTAALVNWHQAHRFAMEQGRVFTRADFAAHVTPPSVDASEDETRTAWRKAAEQAIAQAIDGGWIVEHFAPDGTVRYLAAAPGGAAALESRLLRRQLVDTTRALLAMGERVKQLEAALSIHGRVIRDHMPPLRSEGRRG